MNRNNGKIIKNMDMGNSHMQMEYLIKDNLKMDGYTDKEYAFIQMVNFIMENGIDGKDMVMEY